MPFEWIGKDLDVILVKNELVKNGLCKADEFITIQLWRKFNDANIKIIQDEEIFCCYNLRNSYG